MKKQILISTVIVASAGFLPAQTTVTIGGPSATKDVTQTSSWVANDAVYDLAALNGGSVLNWENINNNAPIVDNGTSLDWLADAGPNYTNGMMFLYDQSIDLSTLGPQGMADVSWTVDFEANTLTNWIPVMEINDGVDTRYYAWDVTGNHWKSNDPLDFTTQGAIGQASNWGEIQTTATGIGDAILDAVDGGRSPAALRQEILDFDGTNWVTDGTTPVGVIRFGFIQWGSSAGGTVNATANLAVQAFEVTIADSAPTPDAYIGGGTAGSTPDVMDVTLWTTGDVAYKQNAMVGTDDGYQGNWENVLQNSSVTNGTTNVFDQKWEATTNHTIGHIYMWNQEAIDLSTLPAGITGLGFNAEFTASFNANWIPILAIENDGVTTFYRSSEAGNVWKGTGVKNFRDWTALASPTDWNGLIDAEVGGMNDTRDSAVQPHLRPTYEWNYETQTYDLSGGPTGSATFGFMQWGASTGGDIDPPILDATLAINGFEVLVYSDSSLITEPAPPQGIDTSLASDSFLYKYEMDSDPTGLDLDDNSMADWFTGVSGGGTHPLTYTEGVAFSNHAPSAPSPDVESFLISEVNTNTGEVTLDWVLAADAITDVLWTDDLEAGFNLIDTLEAGVTTYVDPVGYDYEFNGGVGFYTLEPQATVGFPEILFRNDAADTLFRATLMNSDFTMEVRARVIGPKEDGDVGVLGIAIDPGGAASALRVNIDNTEVSQNGSGSDVVESGANDDEMHTYRVAYIYADDYYFVWRDGVLIYGANSDIGIHGTNGGFNNGGTTWIGDFSSSLAGEWEVDYIRFHNAAVAP